MRMAKRRRDAREAEGARLEIVYSANNGIEGSAPPKGKAERAKRVSTSLSLGEADKRRRIDQD
jgi:hypothetical protein